MIGRIEHLISTNGLTAKDFAAKLGVAPSKITDWRSGKTNPTLKDIIGISQIFNVTSDYLLFGKEYDSLQLPTPQSQNSLTEDESELVDLFRKLPERKKYAILGELKGYVDCMEEITPPNQGRCVIIPFPAR